MSNNLIRSEEFQKAESSDGKVSGGGGRDGGGGGDGAFAEQWIFTVMLVLRNGQKFFVITENGVFWTEEFESNMNVWWSYLFCVMVSEFVWKV